MVCGGITGETVCEGYDCVQRLGLNRGRHNRRRDGAIYIPSVVVQGGNLYDWIYLHIFNYHQS